MASDLPYKQILYLGLTASCLMGNTVPLSHLSPSSGKSLGRDWLFKYFMF